MDSLAWKVTPDARLLGSMAGWVSMFAMATGPSQLKAIHQALWTMQRAEERCTEEQMERLDAAFLERANLFEGVALVMVNPWMS